MKKYISIFLIPAALCAMMCGCLPGLTPPSQEELEEMEIYQVLNGRINENASLDEMLDAFSAMCEVPIEVTSDTCLLEVHQYEIDGQSYMYCTVVRQIQIPSYYETIELGFTVEYKIDEDMPHIYETTTMEDDWQEFISHIQDSEFYRTFHGSEIFARRVGITVW